eukprot:4021549-Pyramimonas_sp.AAC.1
MKHNSPAGLLAVPRDERLEHNLVIHSVLSGRTADPTSPLGLGREWSSELVMLSPLLPLRGGGPTSPYPLPLDLEGGFRE